MNPTQAHRGWRLTLKVTFWSSTNLLYSWIHTRHCVSCSVWHFTTPPSPSCASYSTHSHTARSYPSFKFKLLRSAPPFLHSYTPLQPSPSLSLLALKLSMPKNGSIQCTGPNHRSKADFGQGTHQLTRSSPS